MNPGVSVERLRPYTDVGAFAGPDDVVFRQRDKRVMSDAPRRYRELLYPRIWFNGFHPDVVSVPGPPGPVSAPLGADHSSLVLYAWHRGMTVAETAKLFVEPVFAALGFLDCWGAAKRAMLEEGEFVGFSLDGIFARVERQGCFMRTPAHPALIVSAEIARALSRRAGLPISLAAPELYLEDAMIHIGVWPVYPEIARRLGLAGGYAFKPAQPPSPSPVLFDLHQFIERSFEAYAQTQPAALMSKRLENPAYRDLEGIVAGERAQVRREDPSSRTPEPRAATASPYASLPAERFWRRAVERVPARDVDPVGTPPFDVDRTLRIATAGSCFAQHMSRELVRHGYNYFVAERPPLGLTEAEAARASYGVFSTRCGNVYTARQLLQLFDRAYGAFTPRDRAWLRPDGRHADPFRPQIEPDGFASAGDVERSRETHLASVRTMFEQLDVFVFTLGLTEAWRSTADGAVFPLAPGVAAGQADDALYEFVNFTAGEITADLDAFVQRLKRVNARARIVLTVSPQPPIATYEPRHVLVSASYSKAALRVAADEVERAHPDVWYFPGYEIVAGGFNRGAYYEPDLRTVTPDGVAHVMRLYLSHADRQRREAPPDRDALMLAENRANMDVVCDEDAIAIDGSPVPNRAGEADGSASQWIEYTWLREFAHTLVSDEDEGTLSTGPTMEPLEPSSMRAPLLATLPSAMASGSIGTIACSVRNEGPAALVSAGKHAVFLCYRWYDGAGDLTEVGRSIHTPLPGALEPGATVALSMRIAAPEREGRYSLRASVLQSEVAWFDDIDPGNGLVAAVDVSTSNPASRNARSTAS
jgi:hypothetical protein